MKQQQMGRKDLRLLANLVDWSRVSVQKVFCETFGDVLQQKWKEYEVAKQQLKDSLQTNLNLKIPKTPSRRNPAAKIREQIRQICWKEVSKEEDVINNNLKEDVINILEDDVVNSNLKDSFLIIPQENTVKCSLDRTNTLNENVANSKLEGVSIDILEEIVIINYKTPLRSTTPINLVPKVCGASPFMTFLPLPIRISSNETTIENEQNSTYEGYDDGKKLDVLNMAHNLSTEINQVIETPSFSVETKKVDETLKSSVEKVHVMEQPIVAAVPVLNFDETTTAEDKSVFLNKSHNLEELDITAEPLLNTTFVIELSQAGENNSNVDGNYGIHDLDSGDETDNADYPRKQVPNWAQALSMRHSMFQQRIVLNDDSIARHFGNVQMPKVEEIFTQYSLSNRNSRRKNHMNETTKLEWESPITKPRVGRKTKKSGKSSKKCGGRE